MRNILKKSLPVVLIAAILALSSITASCGSSKPGEVMYPRKSKSSQTVKSNIKVKGTNKSHGHTTRSY